MEISIELAKFMAESSTPPTAVTYAKNGDRAGSVTAWPLTKKPGNTKGAKPGGTSIQGWKLVEKYDYIYDNKQNRFRPESWVRFHILHEELHGPATNWNLIPAHNDDNRYGYYKEIEEPILKVFRSSEDENRILYFKATVETYHSKVPDKFSNDPKFQALDDKTKKDYHELYTKFPISIKVDSGYLSKQGNNFTSTNEKIIDNQVYTFKKELDVAKTPDEKELIMTKVGVNTLRKTIGLTGRNADHINSGKFTNVSELVDSYFADPQKSTWIKTAISYLTEIKQVINDETRIRLFENTINSNIRKEIQAKILTLENIQQQYSLASVNLKYKERFYDGNTQKFSVSTVNMGNYISNKLGGGASINIAGINFILGARKTKTIRKNFNPALNEGALDAQYLYYIIDALNNYTSQ